jgi:hypothetical protein
VTIGIDIKEVLAEVGLAYTLIRNGVALAGGYLDYDVNAQVTKPFIREYFLQATLSYDTPAQAGDIFVLAAINSNYLLVHKTPSAFENGIIENQAVLYKCNVSGELQRASGEVWDNNYRIGTSWNNIKTTAYGTLTENLFGTDLEKEIVGEVNTSSMLLYIPHIYGAKEMDRYQAKSGEYYRIDTVITRQFTNVDVCELSQDTRQ